MPEMVHVYQDFDAVRKRVGIKTFKGKFVKRKYAFGESDVPTKETQWLKVVYPFTGKSVTTLNRAFAKLYLNIFRASNS